MWPGCVPWAGGGTGGQLPPALFRPLRRRKASGDLRRPSGASPEPRAGCPGVTSGPEHGAQAAPGLEAAAALQPEGLRHAAAEPSAALRDRSPLRAAVRGCDDPAPASRMKRARCQAQRGLSKSPA